MPVNPGYEYMNAEKKYLEATTPEQRIAATEEMIRTAPKHKSSENLLALLRTRLKKLQEKQEKTKKVGKSSFKGVKKEGYQCVLIGLPNSGKSSLLSQLTNAKPKVSPYAFTTSEPEIGTMFHEGVKAQIVDLPSIGSEAFDVGTVNTADCLLIVIEKLDDLPHIEPKITRAAGKRIIVLNKSDLLSSEQLRKLETNVRSKRINGVIVSSVTDLGIRELKEKIIQEMGIVRVYTKEPGKNHAPLPVVLPIHSTVKDVAESILKGFSLKVKETRLTGPSSKFPNQKVGLSHEVKDRDIVEFHTK